MYEDAQITMHATGLIVSVESAVVFLLSYPMPEEVLQANIFKKI